MSSSARAVLVILLLVSSVHSQEPGETRDDRKRELMNGTHAFRRILYDHGFRALKEYGDLTYEPARTLLVVLGDLDVLAKVKEDMPGGLETFVRKGGAALLASDRAVKDDSAREQVLAVAGVTISGETQHNAVERYHEMNFCPRIRPVPGGGLGLFANVGFDGRGEHYVYTNVPSKLVWGRFPGGVRPVAMFPHGTFGEQPRWQPGPPLFAVGGDLGEGRVFVMADHSVFINQMMLPHDTHNVEFSYNLVRWLKDGQRDRVLFLEDGTVQTKLDIPMKSIAIPPEEAVKMLFARRNEILVEAEHVLTRLEDENAFNNRLLSALENAGLRPNRLVRLLLLLGTLIGVLYLVYRIGIRARFRHDTSVPLLVPALGKGLSEEPLIEQRQQILLQSGNLREPAAILIRRWFARLGVDATLEAEPKFEARGDWLERWWLVRRLRQLWRLAAGRSSSRVTPAELWRLQRDLDALRSQWERGKWRTANQPEAPARTSQR